MANLGPPECTGNGRLTGMCINWICIHVTDSNIDSTGGVFPLVASEVSLYRDGRAREAKHHPKEAKCKWDHELGFQASWGTYLLQLDPTA